MTPYEGPEREGRFLKDRKKVDKRSGGDGNGDSTLVARQDCDYD